MKRFSRPAMHAAPALILVLAASAFLPGCINLPTLTLRMSVGGLTYGVEGLSDEAYTVIDDFVDSSGLLKNAVIKTPSSPEIPLTKQGIRDKVSEALKAQGINIPKFLLGMIKPRLAEISFIEINADRTKEDLTHIEKLGIKLVVDQDPENPLLDLETRERTDDYTIRLEPKDKKSANLLSQIKARGDTTGTVHAEGILNGKVPHGLVTIDVVLVVRVRVGFGLF